LEPAALDTHAELVEPEVEQALVGQVLPVLGTRPGRWVGERWRGNVGDGHGTDRRGTFSITEGPPCILEGVCVRTPESPQNVPSGSDGRARPRPTERPPRTVSARFGGRQPGRK